MLFFRCPEINKFSNVTTADKIAEIKEKMSKDEQAFSQLDIKLLNNIKDTGALTNYNDSEKTNYIFD